MKRIIISFIVAFTLLSCTSEALDNASKSHEIRFNISMDAMTKATSSAFEEGDMLSLYATEWDGEVQKPLQVGGNFLNNEMLTKGTSGWTSGRTLYWSDKPCDFYAFYPYQSGIMNMEKYPFSVALDQSGDGFEASDLLYACAKEVSQSDGSVDLTFNHIMSKVVVRLNKGPRFEGEIPSDIQAFVYNTIPSCYVNWTLGTVEKDIFAAKKTIKMKKIDDLTFEAALVPQFVERKTPLIEVVMGGISYLLECYVSFRPGVMHYIDLTMNTSPDQEQIEIDIDPDVH